MPVPGGGELLRQVPMFARVEPAALAELEAAAFLRRLSRGQVLFVEGEPAEQLHVVRAGALKVHLTSAQGGELLLAILGRGHALGELSLLDGGTRSAGATALADTELLAVPAAVVRELLHRDPVALWAVAQGLAVGMRRLTGQHADLVFLDLPRRLAKLLLDSAGTGPDPDVVALPVTQTDLAALLGVTRQSLNRALSGLATRGWVSPGDGSVRIRDVAALTRFVGT